jgi:hypothetical protein
MYRTFKDVAADIRLVWINALRYNPEGNPVHMLAREFHARFEEEYKRVEELYVVLVLFVCTAPLLALMPLPPTPAFYPQYPFTLLCREGVPLFMCFPPSLAVPWWRVVTQVH